MFSNEEAHQEKSASVTKRNVWHNLKTMKTPMRKFDYCKEGGGGKASVNILIRMDVRKTLEWRSMGAKLTSVAFQSPAARGPFSGCWQGQVSRNWKQTIINNQVQVE